MLLELKTASKISIEDDASSTSSELTPITVLNELNNTKNDWP